MSGVGSSPTFVFLFGPVVQSVSTPACLSKFNKMPNFSDPKRIGNAVELNCISYLYSLGCDVSIPFGDSLRYDLIIDYKNKLYRIQCKHANPSLDQNGTVTSISFKTARESGRSVRKSIHYTKEDIDFFATFFNEKCYLIPVEETASRTKILRFLAPRSGLTQGVSFAATYEAEKILAAL